MGILPPLWLGTLIAGVIVYRIGIAIASHLDAQHAAIAWRVLTASDALQAVSAAVALLLVGEITNRQMARRRVCLASRPTGLSIEHRGVVGVAHNL
jgi:hypothetical protein